MKWPFRLGSLAWVTVLTATSAFSSLIIDNGPPDKRNGSEMTQWIEADDFVLTAPARLENVTFWDFEVEGFFAGTVEWQIYSDRVKDGPAQLLFSGTSTNLSHLATGFVAFGPYKEFVTTFSIPPISLPKGTYWLALHNGPLLNNGSQKFFWEAAGNSRGSASHAKAAPFDDVWWSNAFPGLPSDLAFQLNGAAAPSMTTFANIGGGAQISFTTAVGYYYRVEYKDNLTDPSWTPVVGAETITGSGDLIQITDLDAKIGTRPRRFYKVALSYNIPPPIIVGFGVTDRRPQVRFTTVAGYYYGVEYKDNLTDLSWKPVSGAETIVGTGGVIETFDPEVSTGSKSSRVYRVTLF